MILVRLQQGGPVAEEETRMQNWSNPVYDGTLEEAIDEHTKAWRRGERPYVSLIGLEVRTPKGQTVTLRPQHDSIGSAPHPGETVECSALGIGTQCEVLRAVDFWPGGPITWMRPR